MVTRNSLPEVDSLQSTYKLHSLCVSSKQLLGDAFEETSTGPKWQRGLENDAKSFWQFHPL